MKNNVKGAKTARRVDVVSLQWLVGLILLAAALTIRLVAPSLAKELRSAYSAVFEQQGETEKEPIRFAQKLLDGISIHAQAAEIKKAAPAGSSNECYLPQEECTAPVEGAALSSRYGWRKHPITGEMTFHNGVDLAAAEGATVRSALDGMVCAAGYDEASGNYLVLQHAGGVVTGYAHLQYAFARMGEFVQKGECIATVGQTGSATGPHLHFTLKHDDVRYDPSAMLALR